MSDLVLGMCGGYGLEAVRPLVSSLRACGSKAELVLLLHRNPEGTADSLRREGVTTVEVDLPGVPDEVSYNVARWAPIARQLRARPGVERALVCDVRDVLFQRDPFPLAEGDSIHLFEEHPAKTIGGCIWTSSWIRYRYGDAALPPLAGRPVLCSGVAIGSAARVRDFADLVASELMPPMRATHYMAGYDQGVVNAHAYWGRIRSLVAHPWATSPVLHLGNAPAGSLRRNKDGQVLNDAGEVAAIVHQLDRHPEPKS